MILAPYAVPTEWTRHLQGGLLGLGYDVATTINKTSNPSSITVTEDYGGKFYQRLVVRFKTEEPEATFQILQSILETVDSRKLRSLCVDSSNEKFHARTVRSRMRKYLPVFLIGGGEKVKWEGADFTYKTLLGQLYTSTFEDGRTALPDEDWITKDHRLVKNHAGSFSTDLDESGNHGDTFDSGKLALWSHLRGARGTSEGARAMAVGGAQKSSRKLKGSFGTNRKNRLNS